MNPPMKEITLDNMWSKKPPKQFGVWENGKTVQYPVKYRIAPGCTTKEEVIAWYKKKYGRKEPQILVYVIADNLYLVSLPLTRKSKGEIICQPMI